jgi:ubiquinone/menaquinone biosynthesis C-methylase UbiE
MHDRYREKGAPENVEFVTADASSLPLDDDELDAAYSTMTYHEFASEEALAELARVVRPGGRVVTVDWSKTGSGADGPAVAERFGVGDAANDFEGVGFTTVDARTRIETFVHISER